MVKNKEPYLIEQEYNRLRIELDTLHYPEPFRPDAIPLIQHLVSDLVATTTSYKSVSVRNQELSAENKRLLGEQSPMRGQIRSLIEENNRLHLRMIEMEDERVRRDREMKSVLGGMEKRVEDLLFVKGQMKKMMNRERMEREKGRVEDVEGDVNVRVDFETGLREMGVGVTVGVCDPVVLDMVKVMESRIENVNREKLEMEKMIRRYEEEKEVSEDARKRRDEEIKRLMNNLGKGFREEWVGEIVENSENDSRMEAMQEHIDSLNERIREIEIEKKACVFELESRIKEMEEEIKYERERNERMNREIKEMEELIKQIKKEEKSKLKEEKSKEDKRL
ncbi:hypothetical protein ROZALSC1DRAFT_27999, partial [Rozella allomycis CSF55]